MTEEFKSKLAAVIQAPSGALSKQAKFAAMQELGACAEVKKRTCLKLWNILLTQLAWAEEYCTATGFHGWHEVTVATREHMTQKVGLLSEKGVITTLKEIRNQTATAAYLMMFCRWRELVKVSNRRRAKPFLDQNEAANLVIWLDSLGRHV